MQPPTRQHWMDQIRGIAIFLVVAFHAATIMTRFIPGGDDGIPTAMRAALDFFAPYRMPTLMFLSGLLLSRSLAKPTGQFFAGKLRSIAWPYVLWSVILLVVIAELSTFTLSRIAYSAPTYLWYLQFLLFYYAIAWVLTRPFMRWMPLWLPLALGVLGSFGPDSLRFSRFAYLFVFFWLGYLLSNNKWNMRDFAQRRQPAFAVVALLIVLTFGTLAVLMDTTYQAWAMVGPLALCYLVVGWAPLLPTQPALTFIGRQSIVFYVTHFAVIWVVCWWVSQLTTNPWLLWAVNIVAAMLVATVLAILRQRGPLAWAFDFPTWKREARPARLDDGPATRSARRTVADKPQ